MKQFPIPIAYLCLMSDGLEHIRDVSAKREVKKEQAKTTIRSTRMWAQLSLQIFTSKQKRSKQMYALPPATSFYGYKIMHFLIRFDILLTIRYLISC